MICMKYWWMVFLLSLSFYFAEKLYYIPTVTWRNRSNICIIKYLPCVWQNDNKVNYVWVRSSKSNSFMHWGYSCRCRRRVSSTSLDSRLFGQVISWIWKYWVGIITSELGNFGFRKGSCLFMYIHGMLYILALKKEQMKKKHRLSDIMLCQAKGHCKYIAWEVEEVL